MRKHLWILLLIVSFCCEDEDQPQPPSSIEGYWIVRTPDDATALAFEIRGDQDNGFQITEFSVNHNGVVYGTKPVDADIMVTSATEVESMTFVTLDAQPPFFVIRFQQVTVSDDFTEMQINFATFQIDGQTRAFEKMGATRV